VDKNIPPHNLISPKIHQAKKLRELRELCVSKNDKGKKVTGTLFSLSAL
jgi:hypothetical protein